MAQIEEKIRIEDCHTNENVVLFVTDLWRMTVSSSDDPLEELSEATLESFIIDINDIRPGPESYLRSLYQKLKQLDWLNQSFDISKKRPIPKFYRKISTSTPTCASNEAGTSSVKSVVRKHDDQHDSHDDEEDDNDNADVAWKRQNNNEQRGREEKRREKDHRRVEKRDEKSRRRERNCHKEEPHEESSTENVDEHVDEEFQHEDILETTIDR